MFMVTTTMRETIGETGLVEGYFVQHTTCSTDAAHGGRDHDRCVGDALDTRVTSGREASPGHARLSRRPVVIRRPVGTVYVVVGNLVLNKPRDSAVIYGLPYTSVEDACKAAQSANWEHPETGPHCVVAAPLEDVVRVVEDAR